MNNLLGNLPIIILTNVELIAYVKHGNAKINPLYYSGIPFSFFKTSVKKLDEYVINRHITEHEMKANMHLLLKMNMENVTFLTLLLPLESTSSASKFSRDLFKEFGVTISVKVALKNNTTAKKAKVQK